MNKGTCDSTHCIESSKCCPFHKCFHKLHKTASWDSSFSLLIVRKEAPKQLSKRGLVEVLGIVGKEAPEQTWKKETPGGPWDSEERSSWSALKDGTPGGPCDSQERSTWAAFKERNPWNSWKSQKRSLVQRRLGNSLRGVERIGKEGGQIALRISIVRWRKLQEVAVSIYLRLYNE